jgi:hypothetical protein
VTALSRYATHAAGFEEVFARSRALKQSDQRSSAQIRVPLYFFI